ncbi:spore cortex biosynthesis protein YabQ [Lutibacter sp. B2]|nr:spore cortex biosynthesis protein YabQ [Lutibacter sp. B2]
MITYVSEQIYVFLVTLYGGIIIGFIYDLYRIFRGIFNPKKIATMIEDFIFWMVISVASASILIFGNEGELRFYTFLGFVLGALLYNRLLSRIVIKSIVMILITIKKILMKIVYILIYPVKVLISVLKKPVRKIKKKYKPVYIRIKRFLLLPKRMYNDIKKYLKLIREKK